MEMYFVIGLVAVVGIVAVVAITAIVHRMDFRLRRRPDSSVDLSLHTTRLPDMGNSQADAFEPPMK